MAMVTSVMGCGLSLVRSEDKDLIRRCKAKYRGMEDEVGWGSGANTVYWHWFV